ncbi:MAG: O-methyltransferase [Bacteroidia bacterium]|nr:O-methyltransferase [Bacteroidia bacterium]MCO5253789.1 O-methyltransferase [Bacteroidota bacterium]MCZ2131089.1 O-methyltransferase [Bacteroidia bacterium]
MSATTIEEYAENASTLNDLLLDELERYTQTNMLQPRMLSGKVQGRFLSFVSKLIQPIHVLEIGTYSGYSALCMAEGLTSNGMLHTIDINDELEDVHDKFIKKSRFSRQIHIHYGNALNIIPEISLSKWDLVFIDADKSNYLNYYKMVLPNMNRGGVLIADNVLWSGKVLDIKERENDRDTKSLHEFNQFVLNDNRVENFLLPFRDGLMIVRVNN